MCRAQFRKMRFLHMHIDPTVCATFGMITVPERCVPRSESHTCLSHVDNIVQNHAKDNTQFRPILACLMA